jgi:hypothetical protein
MQRHISRGVKRLCLAGLVGLVAIACAACGGGTHAARSTLPAPLVQKIKAEVRKQAVILGASSARTVEVYGPAPHLAIEKASSPGSVRETHVAGPWYLIVLRGKFGCNCPVPPGGTEPHGGVAMEVWSPKTSVGTGYSVGNRLPKTVSRLGGPTVIALG